MEQAVTEGYVEISSLHRGDLLRVRDNVVVTLGGVKVVEGTYRFIDEDESGALPAGELAVFLALVPADDDSAIVVLVNGQVGWVFIDEVVRA